MLEDTSSDNEDKAGDKDTGKVTAEPASEEQWQKWGGKKKQGAGRQKRAWREDRDGVKLAMQYRQRVALTQDLDEALARVTAAYDPAALAASREDAATWEETWVNSRERASSQRCHQHCYRAQTQV